MNEEHKPLNDLIFRFKDKGVDAEGNIHTEVTMTEDFEDAESFTWRLSNQGHQAIILLLNEHAKNLMLLKHRSVAKAKRDDDYGS